MFSPSCSAGSYHARSAYQRKRQEFRALDDLGGNGHKYTEGIFTVHQHSAGPGYEETGTKSESAVIKPTSLILSTMRSSWRPEPHRVANQRRSGGTSVHDDFCDSAVQNICGTVLTFLHNRGDRLPRTPCEKGNRLFRLPGKASRKSDAGS